MSFEIEREEEEIIKAVDNFSKLMKDKMVSKLHGGFSGWNDDRCEDIILKKLYVNLINSDFVDVANFSMMLYYFKENRNGTENKI